MAEGGNERFNEEARKLVSDELNKRGFELISFSKSFKILIISSKEICLSKIIFCIAL